MLTDRLPVKIRRIGYVAGAFYVVPDIAFLAEGEMLEDVFHPNALALSRSVEGTPIRRPPARLGIDEMNAV
jgi:hypothetical protein